MVAFIIFVSREPVPASCQLHVLAHVSLHFFRIMENKKTLRFGNLESLRKVPLNKFPNYAAHKLIRMVALLFFLSHSEQTVMHLGTYYAYFQSYTRVR